MEFKLFAAMMFFGFIATEGAVEYIFGKLFDKFAPTWKWVQMYLSLAVGVGLAFHYTLDIPFIWLGMPSSPVGIVITGVVMGRGANAVHESAQLISGWIRTRFP